jgi:hypothetical protein
MEMYGCVVLQVRGLLLFAWCLNDLGPLITIFAGVAPFLVVTILVVIVSTLLVVVRVAPSRKTYLFGHFRKARASANGRNHLGLTIFNFFFVVTLTGLPAFASLAPTLIHIHIIRINRLQVVDPDSYEIARNARINVYRMRPLDRLLDARPTFPMCYIGTREKLDDCGIDRVHLRRRDVDTIAVRQRMIGSVYPGDLRNPVSR